MKALKKCHGPRLTSKNEEIQWNLHEYLKYM